MTDQTIFANATLVLENDVVKGSLRVTDGVITDIASGTGVPNGALDLEGNFLAPGLIELHTDNLERHLTPRPKVDWPQRAAILAHDCEMAGAGITTVFDAIRVGSIVTQDKAGYHKYARQMSTQIMEVQAAGLLRISHHIHLRAETCSETLIEELAEFTSADCIGIVSMMDHTPGQRQFSDLPKFEAYLRGKRHFTDAQWADYVTFLYELQSRVGRQHEAATVAAARRLGATLASHDDTTMQQVETSHAHGVKMAEFPTTTEAANACFDNDIAVIMGAPNLIRGGSHSGNIAAADLAMLNRLDILSSDYVPSGLLMAALRLGEMWDNLPRGIATVTARPAAAVGLVDRGTLVVGQRADLIRFSTVDGSPVLHETWCAGTRVF